MSLTSFKLRPEDDFVIAHYLVTVPDVDIDFCNYLVYRWEQRYFVKEEVVEQLYGLAGDFRRSTLRVAISMCQTRGLEQKPDKRLLNKEQVGCFFVKKIFEHECQMRPRDAIRKPDFYDLTFWMSPTVLTRIAEKIFGWFGIANPSFPNCYRYFVEEEADRILGPNPRTEPDYPI